MRELETTPEIRTSRLSCHNQLKLGKTIRVDEGGLGGEIINTDDVDVLIE